MSTEKPVTLNQFKTITQEALQAAREAAAIAESMEDQLKANEHALTQLTNIKSRYTSQIADMKDYQSSLANQLAKYNEELPTCVGDKTRYHNLAVYSTNLEAVLARSNVDITTLEKLGKNAAKDISDFLAKDAPAQGQEIMSATAGAALTFRESLRTAGI